MAYPGASTFPGVTTWPGVTTPPGALERDVPDLTAAAQWVNPLDTLILKISPPTGKGMPIVRACPADLVMDSQAPGGYGALTCTLDWPEGNPPPDGLVVAAVVEVVDGRHGGTVWYGDLVDPGYTRTGTGASHRISCLGRYTVLETSAAPLAYIDRDLDQWTYAADYAAGSTQVVDDLTLPNQPDDWVDPYPSTIQMDIPEGSKLDASSPTHMTLQYLPGKYGALPDIVRLQGTHDGSASANFRLKVRVVNAAGAYFTVMDRSFTDTQHDFRLTEGAGVWGTTNARVAQLRLEYDSATDATASQDYFLRWGNLSVVFQRVNRAGTPITDPSVYVNVGEIVDDVIGRLLATQLDVAGSIAHPDTLVEQAAWFEGVTAAGVFAFLEDLAPDYYWAVWGPQLDTQPRFEYRSWRVHPRYVISPDVARIELAGGGDELANRALVSYRAAHDVPASVVVTGSVPELDAAGLTRTMIVDLTGEGTLSKTTAKAKGLDALVTANLIRTSGTATVYGPVLDLREGRMVEPWEIRAGWPVVLADGVLRADGGTPFSVTGSRDGRSTFRLTGASYSAANGTAELTLDGGGRSLFNRVRRPLPRLRKGAKERAREGLPAPRR